MSKPSLLCLFTYDLSTCIKGCKIVNASKFFLILRELHNMYLSDPQFFDPAKDEKGFSFLIGCLCDSLKCENSPEENLQKISLLESLLSRCNGNSKFVSLILPGVVSCLYKDIYSKDPVLLPVKYLSKLLQCLFLLARTAVLNSNQNHFDQKTFANLETVLNSILLKLSSKNLNENTVVHLSQLLTELIEAVDKERCYHWFPFLFDFLFKVYPKLNHNNQRQIITAVNGSKVAIEFLEKCQEERTEKDSFLLISYMFTNDYLPICDLLLTSEQFSRVKLMDKKTFLPVICESFAETALKGARTDICDIFDIPPVYRLLTNSVPFKSISQLLYHTISTKEQNLNSLVIVALYSTSISCSTLAPFIDDMLIKGALTTESKEIRLAYLKITENFINSHENPSEVISSMLIPLVENVFNEDLFVSHLSIECLNLLAQKCAYSCCRALVKDYNSFIFGKLTASLYYKPENLENWCVILANLIRILGTDSCGLMDKCVTLLNDALRKLDYTVDYSYTCNMILKVFEEYFKVNSIFLENDKMQDKLVAMQEVSLKLIRDLKFLLSKDFISVQYFTLCALDRALPFLSQTKTEFLPIVNEYWVFLMEKIRSSLGEGDNKTKSIIAENCLNIITKFCNYCEDFVNARICKELFPLLDNLSKNVHRENLLQIIYCFCTKLKNMKYHSIRQLLLIILPALDKVEVAEKCLQTLIYSYPTVVWFYLNQYSDREYSYQNKNDSFENINFSSFKLKNSTFTLDKYIDQL